jgi:hypothetical protein
VKRAIWVGHTRGEEQQTVQESYVPPPRSSLTPDLQDPAVLYWMPKARGAAAVAHLEGIINHPPPSPWERGAR